MSSVYVVGTFDTKGGELQYVAALIANEGVPVTTVDVGTAEPGGTGDAAGTGDDQGPSAGGWLVFGGYLAGRAAQHAEGVGGRVGVHRGVLGRSGARRRLLSRAGAARRPRPPSCL